MGTWGSEQSRARHTLTLTEHILGLTPWVAPVAVLGARARRGVEEALILAEFSQRERARLERVRAAVIGGYWTDELGEGEEVA